MLDVWFMQSKKLVHILNHPERFLGMVSYRAMRLVHFVDATNMGDP